jgi:hypothetical protein
MSKAVGSVVATLHTADGEEVQLNRLADCEEKLAKAEADAAHYQNVARLLADKLAVEGVN